MSVPFAHLHVHSHYSPLDGVATVEKLLSRAKELNQPAMAITDHGVLYGAVDFYVTAKRLGVKPLIGFEANVAAKGRRTGNGRRAYNHLVLIAGNLEGYRNLSRICSEGFLAGFDHVPIIDEKSLEKWADGIVCLSGCIQGEVQRHILEGNASGAERAACWHRDLFGEGRYFLEIMQNGLDEQKRILPAMRGLSRKTGIPLVATADVHYVLPEHKRLQDIMLCVRTGKLLSDEKRMHAYDGCCLKSVDEMLAALPGFEDAVENAMRVVDMCDLELPLGGFHFPKLDVPHGLSSDAYMSRICLDGLRKRYGDPLPDEVVERFEKERAVVVKMNVADYFLVVWDIVKFARENGIAVGPGRGSAASSIIAYGLGITGLDPLKYGLFFERFLNECRNEMPGIDLDFDKERRPEVVAYIISRHGADHCAKIITFGRLSLRFGIRDVGRVMSVPLPRADKLASMIPCMPKPEKDISPIASALKTIPELRDEYDKDPETKALLDAVGELAGVMRSTGVHAAGILVADRDVTDYAPLAVRDGEVTTQYETKALEKFGLCKIDVLELEALSLIKNTVAAIKKTRRADLDIDAIPLDDKSTFDMLSRGDARGVFQFGSEGFRQLLIRLKPDVFEDLVAAAAIYRPGSFQFIDSFINRKHKREPIPCLHPKMEPILRDTYGLILYQEQVMALARDLARFSLSEGDLMRRAMGKRDATIMAAYREKFIAQAAPDIGRDIAKKIYGQVEAFAGYGFNKSHSVCYALIAYRTAYLKCHFPLEYMEVSSNFEVDRTIPAMPVLPAAAAITKEWDRIEQSLCNRGVVSGIATGFTQLDLILNGLHKDELIVIAGQPAMGKTAFALNIVKNVATQSRRPAVFFSIDASSEYVARRLLTIHARIDVRKLVACNFSSEDLGKLVLSSEKLSEAPLWIDSAPNLTLKEFCKKSREIATREDIQLIAVDCLQLMASSAWIRNQGREREMAEITRGIKNLAMELHIPVIVLSQLSRRLMRRHNLRPVLSDLHGSGTIEEVADTVLMLYREEYSKGKHKRPGIAEVIIAKQRNGPCGTVELAFVDNQMRFENLYDAAE